MFLFKSPLDIPIQCSVDSTSVESFGGHAGGSLSRCPTLLPPRRLAVSWVLAAQSVTKSLISLLSTDTLALTGLVYLTLATGVFVLATHFTPLASLAGGALIGLAAVLFMALSGRIAGISGIVNRLLPPSSDDTGRVTGLAFVVGLLAAAPLYMFLTGTAPVQTMSSNLPLLAIAGLLVGAGSVLGSGCTSGHGVCGISRLSMRSIIATLTYMSSGALAVFLLRQGAGS